MFTVETWLWLLLWLWITTRKEEFGRSQIQKSKFCVLVPSHYEVLLDLLTWLKALYNPFVRTQTVNQNYFQSDDFATQLPWALSQYVWLDALQNKSESLNSVNPPTKHRAFRVEICATSILAWRPLVLIHDTILTHMCMLTHTQAPTYF